MKYYGIILILILIGLVLFFTFTKTPNIFTKTPNVTNVECTTNTQCVTNAICHPSACINSINLITSGKGGSICIADCSGPLDCGKGTCQCINSKCAIVST